ncbi:galactose mutarotase-like domain-containing protein [Crepidotus variabilis]|uniref:Glucose-6-phosphate 1-epimerase n=1 Tax=Crepidotus variabilis TaxID=179855 RepID=A0A9P6ECJ2_9AGAR|nr:galactose mutarotase-like domain-containing protein [Crepidotus variabilis]
MPVENTSTKVTLTHPKGSTAEILLYGVTVVSWKVNGAERLFVSSKASLDGSKPIRGGIPVVFPCFGPPSHPDHSKLAQHGFARSETWKFDSIIMDNQAGVSVRLSLEPNDHIKSIYSKPFSLTYVVTLAEQQLSTDIHVGNPPTSHEALEFQALLHNYIRAPSDEVKVSSLKGLSYYDKTEKTEEAKANAKTETRDQVDVKTTTDSVYEDASLHYKVTWPGHGLEIRAKNLKDVVIWNPQEEGSKIGDMEAEGWKRYICVEPGFVRGFVKLEPGKFWIGQQVLTVDSE